MTFWHVSIFEIAMYPCRNLRNEIHILKKEKQKYEASKTMNYSSLWSNIFAVSLESLSSKSKQLKNKYTLVEQRKFNIDTGIQCRGYKNLKGFNW